MTLLNRRDMLQTLIWLIRLKRAPHRKMDFLRHNSDVQWLEITVMFWCNSPAERNGGRLCWEATCQGISRSPMSNVQKTTALVETSRQGPDTPLAHRRPRYPLASCFPSKSAGKKESGPCSDLYKAVPFLVHPTQARAESEDGFSEA